jgi:phospholipid/cholesterol/gamma-HCH transport system substrate-binding protein
MAWEDKISTSFASIMNSYLGIKSSMDEIKRAVASGEFNFKEIAGDVVPTLNNTLLEMQQLMIKLENTLQQYDRSPSDILYKQEIIKKGPGER